MSVQFNPSAGSLLNSGASQAVDRANQQLASGQRINSAADDAAGLLIADRLTNEINGNQQAINNSIDGTSLLQVAGGGLNQITDGLQRLRELGVQAGNGLLNSDDRAALQQQADAIVAEIQGTLSSTTFGGQELLTQDGSLSFQVGESADSTLGVNTYDVGAQLNSNGLYSLDFSNPGSLSTALTAIDDSLQSVGTIQAEYGAQENAFTSRVNQLFETQANEQEARSRIQDADYAATVSDQIANGILEKSSLSVQAQANANASRVLNLLTT